MARVGFQFDFTEKGAAGVAGSMRAVAKEAKKINNLKQQTDKKPIMGSMDAGFAKSVGANTEAVMGFAKSLSNLKGKNYKSMFQELGFQTEAQERMSKFKKTMQPIGNEFKALGSEISGGMKGGLSNVMKFGSGSVKTFRVLTKSFRNFRMEMLGVMFFGMAITGAFTGLLAPALKLSGVFELISTVLGLFFLPFALALLDVILPLADSMLNMSDETKVLIGWIAMAAAGFGLFMMVGGQLVLGLGGLVGAFLALVGPILGVIGPTGLALAAFAGLDTGLNFVDMLSKAWTFLKEAISAVWKKILENEQVKQVLEDLGFDIDNMWVGFDAVLEKVKEVWAEFIKTSGIETAWEDLLSTWDSFETSAGVLWETLKKLLKTAELVGDALMEIGRNPYVRMLTAMTGGLTSVTPLGVGGAAVGAGGAGVVADAVVQTVGATATAGEEGAERIAKMDDFLTTLKSMDASMLELVEQAKRDFVGPRLPTISGPTPADRYTEGGVTGEW